MSYDDERPGLLIWAEQILLLERTRPCFFCDRRQAAGASWGGRSTCQSHFARLLDEAKRDLGRG